ncbi:hypothetical protein MBLNU230_g3979t1 [Neophaeotheca triangularis]
MAVPFQRACFQAARQASKHQSHTLHIRPRAANLPQWPSRPFTSAPRSFAKDDEPPIPSENESDAGESDLAPYFNTALFNSLDAEEQAVYRTLSNTERKQYPSVRDTLEQEFDRETRFSRDLDLTTNQASEEIERQFPTPREERTARVEDNFWNMGEGSEAFGPEDEVREDDISSTAHAQLEQHREIRDFMRRAAWEMPMLARLARPFEPPATMGEQGLLRWRYTTYMGEMHPASRKVVVEFKPADLPGLDETQVGKMCKLAGVRYNPSTGVVKMSCESFETQAQNKRYLGDTIQALLKEARDLSKDDFKDVPLDTRHHKVKKWHRFPEEWLVTEERKAELEARRKGAMLEEGKRVEEDRIVGGVAAIEAARRIQLEAVESPVMAEARMPLAQGKVGKKQMGQQRVQRG